MGFDVERIAELAKLDLTEEELRKFNLQIKKMMTLVNSLPEAQEDAETVPVTRALAALREDDPKASLTAAEVLANAPAAKAGFFCV
ncbi:MAG: Asp-tRNA(Asn)/Glu-tRNA(Gln) amidotransferase subunit GatC [Oscillospiraceae bacterium]|nr:Asp-tRNA(Asn)/Glu-tRNA(Gln) amidotransferase subunit GatC [Oscillospiraceae bacterium]